MATAEGGMYYRVGVAMQTKGKRDKAIVCYKKAILLDPGHAKAHYNLAMALLADGDQTGEKASFAAQLQACIPSSSSS